MALYSELPIFKATSDLLLGIFRFTKDFGNEYKYAVGESIKKETIELLTFIFRMDNRIEPQRNANKRFAARLADVVAIGCCTTIN